MIYTQNGRSRNITLADLTVTVAVTVTRGSETAKISGQACQPNLAWRVRIVISLIISNFLM